MRDAYLDLITEGGYPEVLTIGIPAVPRSWYEGYLSTVIVRDIGDFASLRDAEAIPKVLSLVAARVRWLKGKFRTDGGDSCPRTHLS
jgi:uncharacterized protein